MVKFTLIARVSDALPLAGGLDDDRSIQDSDFFKQQVKNLFKNLAIRQDDTSRSVETGSFIFHYIIEGNVCYLTMCDCSYPKRLAFQYLEDLKNEFERINGNQVETAARPYAFIKFDTFIEKTKKMYQVARTQRNISKLNDEVYEVIPTTHVSGQRTRKQNSVPVLHDSERKTGTATSSNHSIPSTSYHTPTSTRAVLPPPAKRIKTSSAPPQVLHDEMRHQFSSAGTSSMRGDRPHSIIFVLYQTVEYEMGIRKVSSIRKSEWDINEYDCFGRLESQLIQKGGGLFYRRADGSMYVPDIFYYHYGEEFTVIDLRRKLYSESWADFKKKVSNIFVLHPKSRPRTGAYMRLKNKIKDLESENELLRTQGVVVQQLVSSDQTPKGPETVDYTYPADNGHRTVEVHKEMNVEEQMPKDSSPPILLTKQRSLTDRQQENHDILIKCLMEDKGFDKGRPVAACILYKALLQWRSFEAEKTNIFDKIIHTIRSSIEDQDNIGDLAYWLSASSTLLFLLQSTIKDGNVPTRSPYRNRSSPTTLFGRMAQGLGSTSSMAISSEYSRIEGSPDIRTRIDIKYPALLFKQQLTACVEKLYRMISDNLKKEISPFLNQCMHAPRSARIRPLKGSSKSIHSNIIVKEQASSIHWPNIVKSLDCTLTILSENNVPSTVTRKIFSLVFSYINVQLFNSLLICRECCSFSNGEYLKAGLQELESWCSKATEQYVGSSWDELQHIRQAVAFLVLHQKAQKALDEITSDLCPMLSIAQIYCIGTMFWDDKYGTNGLSPEVISKMRAQTLEDWNSIPNNTFLLDVDSSIPFSIEEISQCFHDINLSDVEPPPLLCQRSDF